MVGELIEVDALMKIISLKEENLKTMAVQRQSDIQEHVIITGCYAVLQELKSAVTTHLNKQRN